MAYAKRYAGGFVDKPTLTTPIDATFLNAVEAALLALFDSNPASANMVPVWTPAGTHYVPQLLTNANLDPAAAIAKSKLAPLSIVDADVSGAAAIARSKLNFGAGLVNADIAAAAAIAASKIANGILASQLSGYPADAKKLLAGDGTWAKAIRGRISGAGAITSGTGFTVNRSSVGIYVITFSVAFSAPPVVSLTTDYSGGSATNYWIVNGASASTCTVQSFNNALAAVDSPFHFMAMDAA